MPLVSGPRVQSEYSFWSAVTLIVKTVILPTAPDQSRSSAAMPALLSSDAPNQPPNASQPNAQVATRWPSKLEVFASVDSMPNGQALGINA
jgi:hypothetical protein